MLHRDYLGRMIMELAGAIRKSFLMSKDDEDPEAAAELLEAALDGATEMDGSLLLEMEPQTMATMLQLSGTDPQLVGYISRTLLLESKYLAQANNSATSRLRRDQAFALANSFSVELSDESISQEELERLFDEESTL